MSLCRWWWDYGDSDVYVYGTVGDVWVVETWSRKSDDTLLPPEWNMRNFYFDTADECADFLQTMIEAGFKVSDTVIPTLRNWED